MTSPIFINEICVISPNVKGEPFALKKKFQCSTSMGVFEFDEHESAWLDLSVI